MWTSFVLVLKSGGVSGGAVIFTYFEKRVMKRSVAD
jgi:hypothetical protein